MPTCLASTSSVTRMSPSLCEGVQRRLVVERRARGALGRQHFFHDAARPLERPGDDVEAGGLGVLRAYCEGTILPWPSHREERPHGRRHDLDTLGRHMPSGSASAGELAGYAWRRREHRLLAELRLVLDPVEDVGEAERLRERRPWARCRPPCSRRSWPGRRPAWLPNTASTCSLALAVRALELGRELGAERLDELDALLVALSSVPPGRIQIGPPVRGAALELLRRRGVRG